MKIKRAPGGKSWADAMLMANASNKEYIRTMLDRVQRVEKTIYVQPDKKIEVYFGIKHFLLVFEGRIVLRQTYDYVDCCRGKSPYDFEEELKKVVQAVREKNGG